MQRRSHQVELTVDVNAEAIWAIIRTGENVDKWLEIITHCRVEGNKRFCQTADGGFEEDILESNDADMIFRYTIPKQHLMPVEDIEGKMQVQALDSNRSIVRWGWEFDIEEANMEAVQAGLSQLGQAGIQGIAKLAMEQAYKAA